MMGWRETFVKRTFLAVIALVALVSFGCSYGTPYHRVAHLEIVQIHLMDRITLNEEYQKFCANYNIYPKGKVRGFALVNQNVIYCSEDNERVCGHELLNLLRAEKRVP